MAMARQHPMATALLVAALAGASGPAVAETFDLYVFPYCAPGTSCGFASEQAMRTRILRYVQEMNLIWEVTGLSFRPTIFPIDDSDADFYDTTGCKSTSKRKCAASGESCEFDADCAGLGDICAVCEGPDCVCQEDLTTPCASDSDCDQICADLNYLRRVRWRDTVAADYPLAISMMVTDGPDKCCSNIANAVKPYATLFGIVCDASQEVSRGGSVWAHEMGHHFCLRHTFHAADLVDTYPGEPDYDGDAATVADTPPDPSGVEAEDRAAECDASGLPCSQDSDCDTFETCSLAIYNPGRDFCLTYSAGFADDGSPRPTYCTGGCFRCPLGDKCGGPYGGTVGPLSVGTEWHHTMSYYSDKTCKGPYVLNGVRVEGLSPASQDRIAWCRDNVPNRSQLPDVCLNLGGDVDHDGWCGNEDNCPNDRNTDQQDTDGDGDGNACDLCPLDPSPTGDLDGDGIGDACDPDIDGDDCPNGWDRRPWSDKRLSHRITYVGCALSSESIYVSEADDSDGDGIRNCWDVDDENDERCDDAGTFPWDACFVVPAPSPTCNGAPQGCTGPDPCPYGFADVCDFVQVGEPCPPIWLTCVGTGCEELELHVYDVVNPADRRVVVGEFEIWNRTLYLTPPAGMTVSELARAISGLASAAPSTTGSPRQYRMELVRKDSGAVAAVVVDAFAPGDFTLREFKHGRYVRLHPETMSIDTSYARGVEAHVQVADRDGDGRPDGVDNCADAASFAMTDADADGFGNLCDGDLDNDGLVDDDDVSAVRACVGADLDLHDPAPEPAFEPGFDLDGIEPADPSPDPVLVRLAAECGAADLNDDRRVDALDEAIVAARVGTAPGPSGRANVRPVAEAGPQAVQACGGAVALDAGGSFDPEGAPLGCSWSSATCAIADAAACLTSVQCPPGSHVVTLVVHDGMYASAPDDKGIAVECAGAVPPTMRIAKVRGSGELQLTWESSCLESGKAYGIYEGRLGDWYSHRPVTCDDRSDDRTEAILPASGDTYYLVVPRSDSSEGSYGQASSRAERPQLAGACDASPHAPTRCP
jgi:hypothetical protein